MIAIEEAGSRLEPLKSAIAQVYDAKRKIDLLARAFSPVSRRSDDTREVFIALSAFDHRRREAEWVPMDRAKGRRAMSYQTGSMNLHALSRNSGRWDPRGT